MIFPNIGVEKPQTKRLYQLKTSHGHLALQTQPIFVRALKPHIGLRRLNRWKRPKGCSPEPLRLRITNCKSLARGSLPLCSIP